MAAYYLKVGVRFVKRIQSDKKNPTYNSTSTQACQYPPHSPQSQLFGHEVHEHMRHLMPINELGNEIFPVIVEIVD
jgi:hypothetical protein